MGTTNPSTSISYAIPGRRPNATKPSPYRSLLFPLRVFFLKKGFLFLYSLQGSVSAAPPCLPFFHMHRFLLLPPLVPCSSHASHRVLPCSLRLFCCPRPT